MKNTAATLCAIMTATVTLLPVAGCGNGTAGDSADTMHAWPDTLRVATLYSPTSYFVYRDEPMGYDYALVSQLAADKKTVLDIETAPSLAEAMAMLDSGLVDLVAYEVPVIGLYTDSVAFCGPVIVTDQVLVQPRGKNAVTDVTQLVGKDVYVEKNSKYQHRMANLNDELGGGINIHPVNRDTLITEDLLQMVADGTIPMTVVDSHIARLNATYYPGLDVGLQLSFGQKAQWAVAKDKSWMADSINAWCGAELPRRRIDTVTKRYFQLAKTIPSAQTYDLTKGRISKYDALFRKHAADLGWDWRLLASQGFVESRFDNSVTSWAGAMGIMQVMPSTARANGFEPAQMRDPEMSVKVAVKVLKALDKTFRPYVPDPSERRNFVLAAYNAGGAHILDAIVLAKKHGLNPAVWKGNVENALQLKADPAYFNDPDVKYGYFRGRQTVAYVDQVNAFYARTLKHIKK